MLVPCLTLTVAGVFQMTLVGARMLVAELSVLETHYSVVAVPGPGPGECCLSTE